VLDVPPHSRRVRPRQRVKPTSRCARRPLSGVVVAALTTACRRPRGPLGGAGPACEASRTTTCAAPDDLSPPQAVVPQPLAAPGFRPRPPLSYVVSSPPTVGVERRRLALELLGEVRCTHAHLTSSSGARGSTAVAAGLIGVRRGPDASICGSHGGRNAPRSGSDAVAAVPMSRRP
jgi:hypothetical protein